MIQHIGDGERCNSEEMSCNNKDIRGYPFNIEDNNKSNQTLITTLVQCTDISLKVMDGDGVPL